MPTPGPSRSDDYSNSTMRKAMILSCAMDLNSYSGGGHPGLEKWDQFYTRQSEFDIYNLPLHV